MNQVTFLSSMNTIISREVTQFPTFSQVLVHEYGFIYQNQTTEQGYQQVPYIQNKIEEMPDGVIRVTSEFVEPFKGDVTVKYFNPQYVIYKQV